MKFHTITATADGKMTLAEAGAVAAIMSAAERKAPVARLVPDIGFLMYAHAYYIGGKNPVLRDIRAENDADIRDLFLVVQLIPHPLIDARQLSAWPVRALTGEYLAGTFSIDVVREPARPQPESQADLILAGRMWIADCFESTQAAELSPAEVQAGIERHYSGGWAQFIRDGTVPGPPVTLRRWRFAGRRGQPSDQ